VLVNGTPQGTDFRPKRTQPNPIIRFLGSKAAQFRAKWDGQKSVNYVWAAGINYARPFAGAAAQAKGHLRLKLLKYSHIRILQNKACTFLWRFIEGRRKPRAVKRSETECGLRAAAQISIAFANRAGLAGATIQNLRFDRQDWTCAPPDWP
jgi:hypothetical protein